MLEMLLTSVLIAVVANVFVHDLTGEGMIFGWWQKIIDKLRIELRKPLGECDLCLGGQIALFTYIFRFEYNFIEHILFICVTIFIIKILRWVN